MKINRILFIALMLMVVSLVGCGGSSDSGISVADRSNGGLINVTGRVSGVTDKASVSFYTPEAAMKNGFTANLGLRASISNNGVYTTDTDKAGNYAITVPENTYYVVANEGDRMAVSGRQSFNGRAAYQDVGEISLTMTTEIHGDLVDVHNNPVASVPVYIEDTPFMCVSDSEGHFTFNKVPLLAEGNSYSIVTYFCYEGISFGGSYTFSRSEQQQQYKALVQLVEGAFGDSKTITGNLYYSGTSNPVASHTVMAILPTGLVYSTVTDGNGIFSFNIGTKENSAELTVDMFSFKTVDFSSTNSVNLYVSADSVANNGSVALDIEFTAAEPVFTNDSVNTFVLLKKNGSAYETYYKGMIGIPASNYVISELPAGDYCYVLCCERYNTTPAFGFAYSNSFSVTEGNVTKSPDTDLANAVRCALPYIEVRADGYYAFNTEPMTGGEEAAKACMNVAAYAVDKTGTKTELSLDSVSGSDLKKISLSKITGPGEYSIYVEVKFTANGYEKTISSDLYPYVKAQNGSSNGGQSTIGG